MCKLSTSTVVTTIPKIRTTLRKGNFVKTAPMTTRDPTYANKQINNYAQMPSMVHETRTSNTYNTLPALNQILRGDVLRARATKKDPHQDQTASEPEMKVSHGSTATVMAMDIERNVATTSEQCGRKKGVVRIRP